MQKRHHNGFVIATGAKQEVDAIAGETGDDAGGADDPGTWIEIDIEPLFPSSDSSVTHLVDLTEEHDPEAVRDWAEESEWLGLEILETSGGGEDDETGRVEFVDRLEKQEA